MKNNLYKLICRAKQNDNDSIILLLKKFDPLLIKYSSKLNDHENAKGDLTLKFIYVIKKIPILEKNFLYDKYILSYIKLSISNYYLTLKHKQDLEYITIQKSIENSSIKNEFSIDSDLIFFDLIKELTNKEQLILTQKFLFKYRNIDIANNLKISRQNVQTTLNLSLKKLKKTI